MGVLSSQAEEGVVEGHFPVASPQKHYLFLLLVPVS